ncbi:MAG: GTP-binding protein [Bdellovibrionales bacterium]|nr:GTP-binding protein [Bdellovibrionales bacterium]
MIVGDSGVGKTSIMKRFTTLETTMPKVKSTIGLDYGERIVNLKGKNVLVQIWDTAGQERFQTLTPSYYRSAMGILLVFSVTDKSSFNSVELWMRQIHQYSASSVPVLILCNKIDVASREVSEAQCKALEQRHGVKTIYTSVINNHNISDAIATIYDLIDDEKKIKTKPAGTIHLIDQKKVKNDNSYCKC